MIQCTCFTILIVHFEQDLRRKNVLYGYRIDGPQGWHHGHRYDAGTVLLDPYAKFVEGRRYFGGENKSTGFLGTYDFDSLPFDWGNDYKLPNIPEVEVFVFFFFCVCVC